MSAESQQLAHALQGMDDTAFVSRAYVALLGRPADPAGMADFLGRLKAGVPRMQVLADIGGSEEARQFAARRRGEAPSADASSGVARVNSVADLLAREGGDFVRHAYLAILQREPDPSGLRDYTARLASGASKQQVLAELRGGPEGRQRAAVLPGLDEAVGLAADAVIRRVDDLLLLDDVAFVQAAYEVVLGRPADPGGLARYSELLQQGLSKLHVLRALYRSPEGQRMGSALPGLKSAVSRYEKARAGTLRGWYYRQVKGVESDMPAERQVRALACLLRARRG